MRNSDQNNRDRKLLHLVDRYRKAVNGIVPAFFDEDEMQDVIDYFLDEHDLGGASEAISFALQLHPGNVSLMARQVNVLIEEKHYSHAELLVDELLTQESDNIDALLCKGELLIIQEKFSEAKNIFRKLMISEDVVAENMCLDIAFIYINHQMYDSARSFLLEGYTKGGNHNLDLCHELACCDEQLGFYDEAIDLYNFILDKEPFTGDVWFNLGQLYFLQKDYEKAINAYDYAYLIGKDDYEALLNLGHCYFHSGGLKKAIETYMEYLAKNGPSATVITYIGDCHEQLGDHDTALKCYSQATELEPDNADAWAGAAFCRMEQGKYSQALPMALKAIELNPESGSYWIYLGEIYENLNKMDDALAAYKKSIEFFPDSAEVYASIGEVYIYKEMYEEALVHLLKAQNGDQNIEELPLLLSIAYYKLGQKNLASEQLVIAISRNEDNRQGFFEMCPEAAKDSKFMFFNK